MRQERKVDRLRSTSPGRRLDSDVRAEMEALLGGSLEHVRLHTDPRSERTAHNLGAKAYTIGSDVHFAPYQYQPHTAGGSQLLAHELAHVLQESPAPTRARSGLVSTPDARSEVAASRAARGQAPATAAVSGPLPAIHLFADTALRPSPRVARLLGYLSLEGFATDDHALTGDHTTDIAGHAATLADLLRAYPGGLVLVTGHTDSTGSEAHNLQLGEKRAREVATALVRGGVPATAIVEDSAGESELRVRTASPNSRNRRVEIRFRPEPMARLLDEDLRRDPPPPPPPPPDLRYRPRLPTEEEEIERRIRDLILHPPPDLPARPTISEALRERLDKAVDRATHGLPQWMRDGIRRGVRAGVEKGFEGAIDGLLDAAGVTGEPREAIDAIIDQVGRTPVP